MADQDELLLTSISASVTGNLTKGMKPVLFGLDENGHTWVLSPKTNKWARIHNPIDGERKNGPDDPGDEIPSWRKL